MSRLTELVLKLRCKIISEIELFELEFWINEEMGNKEFLDNYIAPEPVASVLNLVDELNHERMCKELWRRIDEGEKEVRVNPIKKFFRFFRKTVLFV